MAISDAEEEEEKSRLTLSSVYRGFYRHCVKCKACRI
jgi:hypothetical protein